MASLNDDGGYQRDGKWLEEKSRWLFYRHCPRSMEPGEFVALLWRHKHPRFISCGVAQTNQFQSERKERGLGETGSIWFSDFLDRQWAGCAVPANNLPYNTILTAKRDEDGRWSGGEIVKGWRAALRQLTSEGYLRPSRELSYIIGEDAWDMCPAEYRIR